MNVNGKNSRTLWLKADDEQIVQVIDQRHLPHHFVVEDLRSLDDMVMAIRDMHLRGAGLIGAAAGFGMYLAALEAPHDSSYDHFMKEAGLRLQATRPTAVNLSWAVDQQLKALQAGKSPSEKTTIALNTAQVIADSDAESCRQIGQHGLPLIEAISRSKGGAPVNILTHCNAGWLAFVDYGTATAPIYAAHQKGIAVHVWVDETRPRNQGASLTAWELGQQGVPHTIITDNAGGHLMQHGLVDLVIVGSDRTTFTGDVANKIGTYLKALAAKDNDIPFYVALPSSTIDWELEDGLRQIPIEQRDEEEVKYIEGLCDGEIRKVLLAPEDSPAANFAFDVTPARLVTALITERGICKPDKQSILALFPERKS
ncbi:MAG: S-methyl-5-thioribose-1-phosphate isomerase [Bacteroidales bacterium]|jgi:methylthioribose-1-phosphate isomerase|nr:S-methyl-5-thioribose-1-phosphate isomerase [Bacteroidales bacterium]